MLTAFGSIYARTPARGQAVRAMMVCSQPVALGCRAGPSYLAPSIACFMRATMAGGVA